MLLVADGVAGRNILQAHRGADVARQNLADIFALVGVHLQQTPDALVLAGTRIQHRITRLELSGVHPDKGQLADKRVGHDLERQRREGLFVIRLARQYFAVVRVLAMDFPGIERGRQIIHHRIEQRLNPLVLERRSHHHRK